MFDKKKQPPIRTLVGEGTSIRGELRFLEGARIDGEVIGDVIAVGDGHSILVISEKARVVGKVTGGHVIINGTVNGPVHSSELLELQPKSAITGDVHYEVLEMHQGAAVNGALKSMRGIEKPALKLAAANAG
jgi:cytoskeletal protein CcmA (bactofilin family)